MSHFSLRITPAQEVGVVISVSKKVSKKAVVRNRIKRRVRAVMRNIAPRLDKARTYLIIAKPGAEKIKGEVLAGELAELLKRG